MSRARVLLMSVVLLVGGVVAAGCARTDRPRTEMVLAEAGRSDLPGRAATAHD
jgi:hypothetical protein